MFNLDVITNENNAEHNTKWPYIELQNIATNHSPDIDYKDFMNIHRKCTSKPYSFLTVDTTIPADNPLRFRNNLLDSL